MVTVSCYNLHQDRENRFSVSGPSPWALPIHSPLPTKVNSAQAINHDKQYSVLSASIFLLSLPLPDSRTQSALASAVTSRLHLQPATQGAGFVQDSWPGLWGHAAGGVQRTPHPWLWPQTVRAWLAPCQGAAVVAKGADLLHSVTQKIHTFTHKLKHTHKIRMSLPLTSPAKFPDINLTYITRISKNHSLEVWFYYLYLTIINTWFFSLQSLFSNSRTLLCTDDARVLPLPRSFSYH